MNSTRVNTSRPQDRGWATFQLTRWTVFVLLCFVGVKILQLTHMAPGAEIGGDAALKWDFARQLTQGNLDRLMVDAVSQHDMRWGSWLWAVLLIAAGSDQMAFYYLATAIPAILGGVVFIVLVARWSGNTAALAFALFFAFDPHLFRATFQLLPTGAAILPLGLLLAGLLSARLRNRPVAQGLVLAACCFWLYGAKETNLFFAPGVALFMWIQHGFRHGLLFSAWLAAGYVLETLALMSLTPTVGWLGRAGELLGPGSLHLVAMEYREVPADYGVFTRWVTHGNQAHDVVFLSAIALFALALLTPRHTRLQCPGWRAARAASLPAATFVVCTSFFFISLFPLRAGQPVMPRYLAILLPLAYFVIAFYGQVALRRFNQWLGSGKNETWRRDTATLTVGTLVIALCSFTYHQFTVEKRFGDWGQGIAERSACYREVGRKIEANACFIARKMHGKDFIYLPLFVPLAERGPNHARLLDTPTAVDGLLFRRTLTDECESEFDLTGQRQQCGTIVEIR